MFWWSLTGQPNDVQHFMLQHSAVCNKSENRMQANRSACICQFWLGWILRQRWSEYVTSLTTSSVSQQWSVVFCLVKPTDTQALRLVDNLSKRVSPNWLKLVFAGQNQSQRGCCIINLLKISLIHIQLQRSTIFWMEDTASLQTLASLTPTKQSQGFQCNVFAISFTCCHNYSPTCVFL